MEKSETCQIRIRAQLGQDSIRDCSTCYKKCGHQKPMLSDSAQMALLCRAVLGGTMEGTQDYRQHYDTKKQEGLEIAVAERSGNWKEAHCTRRKRG